MTRHQHVMHTTRVRVFKMKATLTCCSANCSLHCKAYALKIECFTLYCILKYSVLKGLFSSMGEIFSAPNTLNSNYITSGSTVVTLS